MRKKIVVGNWKMNKNALQTESLLSELVKNIESESSTTIIVAPTFVNLEAAVKLLQNKSILVAAQNMHQSVSGAFTGEISADMLKSIGVKTVILGHSERRSLFGEDNILISDKVKMALKNDMTAIFCFGEDLKERKNNKHFNVVESQLRDSLFNIDRELWKNIILAYEPVWSIGTGQTATSNQIQEMHAFIRNTIHQYFKGNIAENVSILYGGSVKPENAKEIFSLNDVDGGLIGGAALNATDFTAIIKSM